MSTVDLPAASPSRSPRSAVEPPRKPAGGWAGLADRVLSGGMVDRDEARAVLASGDEELLDVLAAAYRVRHRHFGNTVQLFFLMNAKSGLCPEDCGYCSQSKVSSADIPRYNLLAPETLLDAARVAAERQSKTFCIVISARGPTEREIDAVCDIVPKIKARHDLNVCACLGLLDARQAQRLAAAGVDKVNHNLNTSARHYPSICTTHTHADRLATLQACREAGLALCSGGIMGMGEEPEDLVDMAFELRHLGVESIPLNFLTAIDGTPLAGSDRLSPRDCLRGLAMMRLVNPEAEIRIAGGREVHLRSLQPLGLYPANSIFVGDYLTTPGQPPAADYAMITDMGFRISRGAETPASRGAERPATDFPVPRPIPNP
ncbi:MAG: biotin synthase BioB [Planctomycetia bacterium]|nr:biotin synthase BioB [Planctomycetia bacterium]